MKLSYERDMAHNYMIPETEGTVEVQSWQVQMLTENQIRGLLRCIVKRINGKNRYCYEITSRQSMAQIYETRVIRIGEIRKILGCLYRTLRETENYLLDVERIVLEPECIYMDIETGETWFCYLPEYQTDMNEAIRKLTSWFLRHLDQHDPTSVLQGYELYRKAMEQQGSIQELLKFAMALSGNAGNNAGQKGEMAGQYFFDYGNPGQDTAQENGTRGREATEEPYSARVVFGDSEGKNKEETASGSAGSWPGEGSRFSGTAGRNTEGAPFGGIAGQSGNGSRFSGTAGRNTEGAPFGGIAGQSVNDSRFSGTAGRNTEGAPFGETADRYRTTPSFGNPTAGVPGKKAFFSCLGRETGTENQEPGLLARMTGKKEDSRQAGSKRKRWILPAVGLSLAAALTITGALAGILTWTQAGEILFLAAGLVGYCISVITRKQKEEKDRQGDLAFKREEKAERARQKREKKFARKQTKTGNSQKSGGISENGKRISGTSEMTTVSGMSGDTTGMTTVSGMPGTTAGMPGISGVIGNAANTNGTAGNAQGNVSGGTGETADPCGASEPVVGATTLLWEGEETYKPHLTLISMNSRDRQSVVLLNDSYLIGKLKSNVDIRINDPSVSRIHARIQKEGDEYFLQDLNATNGTFLNGRRLEVQEKVRIQEGDEITFAETGYYVGRC